MQSEGSQGLGKVADWRTTARVAGQPGVEADDTDILNPKLYAPRPVSRPLNPKPYNTLYKPHTTL